MRCAFLLFPLLLGGCAVGDGVAQAVKWGVKNTSDSGDKSATASAAAPAAASVPVPAAAPVDRDPPPAAQAAPRDDIKVESLPPPQ
jgi:hypothetical protein